MALCGAKTRSGAPCRAPAMANGRCYVHGGKTPRGPASPHFRTGRYSKYLPKGLMDLYETARQDTELVVLRDEIALMDARIADLLMQLSAATSADVWEEAARCHQDLSVALQAKNLESARDLAGRLGALLQGKENVGALWAEIARAVEARRRLVETEQQRLVRLNQMITAEQAMLFVAAVINLVRQHVTDRQALQAISDGLRALVAAGHE